MSAFLIYEGKAAVALLVFYLFYRFLLKKETFHRLNRAVLVGTMLLSFVLPLCVITVRKPIEALPVAFDVPPDGTKGGIESVLAAGKGAAWIQAGPTVLLVLFWAGVAVVLVHVLISVLSIVRIIRQGKTVCEDDDYKITVTERKVEPFSWMRHIVLSRTDWEAPHDFILAHEKAHIRHGHSAEVLLVDILGAFQWFNPAVWMLRADLREIHEYEADDAVLRTGADIREYQYLLIKKTVGKSGYSVANSLNHSILKKRITMMSKSKSPLFRGLRALYVLPLVCLCIGLQAQTVYDPVASPLFILRQARGVEKVITRAEFDRIEPYRIRSIDVLKDESAKEKYGERGADGVVIVTLKGPQELEEIVVVSYQDAEDVPAPSYYGDPDTMPVFQGEGASAFSRWLSQRIVRPSDCGHAGMMNVSFVVAADGNVKDVVVVDGVCEELDALVVSLVRQSPKWEPATAGGRPVEQCLMIPISFHVRHAVR